MNKKILVLGIGSPFADDTAGWVVSDKLLTMPELQNYLINGSLNIMSDDRPGLNLIDYLMRDYQEIILVDMVKTNLEETGNIYHLKAKDIIGFSGMLSSHNLGVSPSLALADALGININNVTFWGIEGERFKPEEVMSIKMLEACDTVTQKILRQILSILQ